MSTSTRRLAPLAGRASFRRAVVTGGCGFVGSHLCDVLLDSGVDVVCVDNLLTGTADNVVHRQTDGHFQLLVHDVTDPLSIPGAVDLVLHLASPASPQDYMRLPIETLRVGSLGTLNTLELARRKKARFILASTSEVYGDPLEHPQRESYWGNVNPVGPRSVYDEAKRFAEAATTAYRTEHGVDTAIVRIFNTFGPRMRAEDGRAVPTFIRQALAGESLTVTGDGSQTRSLCYVGDTVRGILAVAAGSHPGPVNLGNPTETTVLELAHLVRELTGSAAPVEFVDRPVDDPERRRPDITLAWEQFGWKPETDPRKGLSTTIDWFAAQLNDTAVRER
ncbi:SDR family oxidoreductase [Streptomyces scabiei]|uniref:UDP-glucuronic acid decarboxylase family protein n=1 Tax=Streptomyces scabiei TaxID=1930 RepID=UPI000765B17F|nr:MULTISPECIES: UDP-glucuronic acid decarboxylase family protein [Streptomyces]MBP5870528.1 SDR family oxidoreductase [Streptomyces sp. LBUM 1485]MDW8476460.1 UDP-glucuronic acid decarboxylase family protein [Streptomyces scabiei]MDX2566961.1 SDR family oxidoreductase [Streptomyces scabiei]MDX2829938.1 SDR family oxidoreductase [Streptomyces scabiei]MDX3146047.1 SDR family oxidoreductase [Streptomyces scabiei]